MKEPQMTPQAPIARRKRFLIIALAVALLLILAATAGLSGAQTNGAYDLSWWTADGGGGVSAGSHYTLQGTAGQADAGALSGDAYTLTGGFWGGVSEQENALYLPAIRAP